jgi:hypothetical protein
VSDTGDVGDMGDNEGYTYYVSLNIDNDPITLYRYHRDPYGIMEVWHNDDRVWIGTLLSLPEIQGLGGSPDYRRVTDDPIATCEGYGADPRTLPERNDSREG